MPSYDYQCLKCKAVEEHFHSVNAFVAFICQKCTLPMVKMTSIPALMKMKDGHAYDGYATEERKKKTNYKKVKEK